ncbi:MAG: hypothetical protein AUH01_05960 [Acidobacteria bacterium 13_2_20CM_56_17]|nr:MAG: hypothetical protein AUH01_05960 [Acidobacteria bacterium 13_2_20CM_56_17]
MIQINEVRQVPELAARIESLVQTLGRDIPRIKRSRVGQSIRKWLPVGIGSAVTLGAAFLPNNPLLKYVVMPPIEPGLGRIPGSSRFRDKGRY